MARSRVLISGILFCSVWAMIPSSALAMYTVDNLGDSDASLAQAERLQWPVGTLNLINDDMRIAGWHGFFSEMPNDVYRYGFQCHNAKDVNHLIALLAQIEAEKLTVLLSPRPYGTMNMICPEPRYAVSFAIGSQKIMNEWFERLPVEEGLQRRRVFGLRRYTEVPTATPPTLTVYLGNDRINMKDLRIPAKMRVASAVGKHLREAFANDPMAGQINEFVIARLERRLAELRRQLKEVQAQLDATKVPTTAPAREE